MMQNELSSRPPKRLSPLKWIAGVVGLLVVMIVCGGTGLFLRNDPVPATAPNPLNALVMIIIGAVLVIAGSVLYWLTLLTGGFTLNFAKPFYTVFGIKIWISNLLVSLLWQAGVAFIAAPALIPLVGKVLPGQLAVMVGFFTPFVLGQFVLIWLDIWAPLQRIAPARRLRGRGLTDAHLASGRFIGTSDPTRTSFRRLGWVEQDLGMLWIGADRLVYWGDEVAWEIPHDRLIAIERKADAGSVSSYFGAVQVIVVYRSEAGEAVRIRLHTLGDWTMTGKARAFNNMAARLSAWLQTPRPGWATESAFPVQDSLGMS